MADKKSQSEFGMRVLSRLGLKGMKESGIRKWLESHPTSTSVPAKFPHTIKQWSTSDPSLKKLKTLGITTGRSLDHLIGSLDSLVGHNGVNDDARSDVQIADAGKEWLSSFLDQCEQLSCYIVFLSREQLESWKTEIESLGEADGSSRLTKAEAWSKKITISNASNRFRRQHGIPDVLTLREQTMLDLLDKRIEWTRGVPHVGPELAAKARVEALESILRVIESGLTVSNERYPALYKGDQEDRAIRSLRVSFDALPSLPDERGFIIYYHWGPPLSDAAIQALLPATAEPKLLPEAKRKTKSKAKPSPARRGR